VSQPVHSIAIFAFDSLQSVAGAHAAIIHVASTSGYTYVC